MMRRRQWTAGLLVIAMLMVLVVPVSAANPTVTVAPEIKYATDSGAFLKNIELSQTGAWNLTVKANPTASGQTYAVLLRYDLFNANYNTDGSIGGITPGTYTSLAPGTANSNYYRYENATAVNGTVLTIFNKALYKFTQDKNYPLGESSTTYHMRYALVIFDGGTDVKDLSDYTIVSFYINSQGWLQTESYMLRYMQNKYPTGTNTVGNMPGYQIEGWTTDAPVNGTTRPTRTGYTFLGWDANSKLMNADANTAAAQVVTPQYPVGNTGPVPWGTISTAFGTTTFNKDSDKFYNLYAQWRPNAVKFDLTNAPTTGTVNGVNIHILTLPDPQVGVAYGMNVKLAVSPTDGGTAKEYSYQSVGSTVTIGSDTGTIVDLSTAYKLTVAATGNNSDKTWRISGTPTEHSDGKDVYAVLQVKDKGNNTTDLIILHFDQVKKGAQPVPTLDDNPGLQSRVVSTKGEDDTEVKDGQIYGFYSAGPKKGEETGYLNDTNGTGTMTQYYLNNRMVYEYRPVLVEGEEVDYTGLPNEGWREVPMPRNFYGAAYITGATRTAWENSMKLNAKDVIYTEYAPKTGSHAPVRVITELSESFKETGWPTSYGWIEYADESNNAIPIIHGLAENDKYEVRFRSNTAYEVSKSQPITIGGAVASSGEEPGGAGGLAVNLSGGDEPKDDAKTVYDKFVSDAAALKPGDTLAIPDFTPTRENYSFAGWTLGERDENGQLILYRAGDTGGGEEPPAPETVTVIWLNDDGTEITRATFPGGTTEYPFPETATAPSKEGHTLSWSAPVTNDDGSITITAEYTAEEPEARDGEGAEPTPGRTVTVTWVDPLQDGEDKTVKTAEGVELTPEGDLPDTVTHPEPPTHEGKTFEKWEKAVDAETGNVTYTAVYKDAEEPPSPTQTVRDTVTMPQTGPASLAAVWEGGKPNPNDFASIVFYDWDETTVLGSIVVAKGVDATEEVNKFVRNLQSPESKDVDSSKEAYWVDDPKYPMTYKKGYSFEGCWLPYDSDIPTVYGTRVSALNANQMTTPERPVTEETDFSNVAENLIVKAAYNENPELSKSSAVNRRYTAQAVGYTRFGTTANYGITIEVRRENARGEGVPRIISPALRVTLATSAGNILMLLPLDSTDVASAQVVANASVTQVSWVVVETYGNNNWAGAAVRTANASSPNGTMNVKDSGFLYLCTFGGINDMLEEYTLTGNATVYNYINMGSLTGIGLTTTGNTLNQAKEKLVAAWKAKNSITIDGEVVIKPENERIGLTFDEMNAALAN